MKKYYQSHREQILERQRRYRQSPKFKEYKKDYMKKYSQSPKYKESQRRYYKSLKHKEYIKRYQQSPKYKEYRKNYRRLHNQKVLSHTPAKPDGAGSKNTGYGGHTVPSGLNREESETDKESETGGGFTIIHMDKITDKKD